ncbi:rubrerythrin [Methanobacterium oryzae]|uniref:rubrerythrin n=1 Tax=Methanobacterium oryzae TaxID=69540 RepID=UPI003D1B9E8E
MQKTMENLAKAFIGESQARNRYTLYSKVAKKEGYNQLSEIFLVTAENEREHAKWLMKMIQGLKEETGKVPDEIVVGEAAAPVIYGTTVENLKSAIAGEHYENSEMYPEFANVAQDEELYDISERLRAIAHAEEHHEERYRKILAQIEAGTLFKKEKEVEWTCRKCGYTLRGMQPPIECPSCDHPREYFEIKCEEY